jgi:hypothetical protein
MQFFTVSVFLFWGTLFFEIVFEMDKNLAMFSVGLVCVTSPIIGVIIGGTLTDNSGGAKNLDYCLFLSFKLTFLGYIFINVFTLMSHPVSCIFTLWIGIMFGK